MAPPTAESTPPYDHHVSVTVAPVQLIFPVVRVTTELRGTDRLGVSVVTGAGSVPDGQSGRDESHPHVQAGFAATLYPIGSFDHGLATSLDVDLYHTWGTTRVLSGDRVRFTETYVWVGPHVGYKLALRIGPTVTASVGPVLELFRGTSSLVADPEQSSEGSAVGTDVSGKLGLGWSF